MKWLVDLLFPPICEHCSERCDTVLFCPSCWEECRPPDPLFRCRHCFKEVEEEGLCAQCRERPDFFFVRAPVFESWGAARSLFTKRPEALAGYFLYQWVQLDWPVPDFVMPLPHRVGKGIGKEISEWLGVEYVDPFKWWSRSFIEDLVPEDATLLLLDIQNPFEVLKRYESEIAESCPKKCFLLSLEMDSSRLDL